MTHPTRQFQPPKQSSCSPLLTGSLMLGLASPTPPWHWSSMQPNTWKYFSRLFLPFPPGNHVSLPSASGRLPPFSDAMPRCLPPPLFALCPWLEASVFGPYLVFYLFCICLSLGYPSLRGCLAVAWGRPLSMLHPWATLGHYSLSVRWRLPSSLGSVLALLVFFSPVSGPSEWNHRWWWISTGLCCRCHLAIQLQTSLRDALGPRRSRRVAWLHGSYCNSRVVSKVVVVVTWLGLGSSARGKHT